jgi:2-oxoglutarate ferredoxin oxidoreductase subunit delta
MAKRKVKSWVIERGRCKGCGICVHFCPKKVLVLDGEEKAIAMHPDDCIACGICEMYCPDLAIEIEDQAPAGAVESDARNSAPPAE